MPDRYASTPIAANLNPKVIQGRLGHATIAQTMGHLRACSPGSEELSRL